MERVFLTVLNMSLTASFVIIAIMLARLPLKKAPKTISYILWAAAWFRLAFPFTLEAVFSLLPIKASPIPQDIAMQTAPRIDTGISAIDTAVSAALPAAVPAASANPLQIWLFIGSLVWLLGIAVMLVYSAVSIVMLKRKLRCAVNTESNIFEADNLKTPFVIGLFKPKIYIPANLTEDERLYIVLHEQTHIKRCDHAVKMLAYLILCLHWFNPFAWAAFILMGADMEMSCDERVLRELGGGIKNAYSMSLVRVAAGRKIINGSPLAFGEGGMKERIRNVLKFKKSSRVIIITAAVLAAVLAAGFITTRESDTGISAEAAIRKLVSGISYEDGLIKFQIPEDFKSAESWNIHISGRAEAEDGFSQSVHEFEGINDSHDWQPGRVYVISGAGRNLTELTMDIMLPDLPDENGGAVERTVDLLALVPESDRKAEPAASETPPPEQPEEAPPSESEIVVYDTIQDQLKAYLAGLFTEAYTNLHLKRYKVSF